MKQIFHERRDLILKELKKIPKILCEVPNGAFYVFPNFKNYLNKKTQSGKLIKTSSDLSLYILDQTGVVTVAGDSFGAPGHIRLSYATSNETISKAVSLIGDTLKRIDF
jgi:aspartate aminotransferase